MNGKSFVRPVVKKAGLGLMALGVASSMLLTGCSPADNNADNQNAAESVSKETVAPSTKKPIAPETRDSDSPNRDSSIYGHGDRDRERTETDRDSSSGQGSRDVGNSGRTGGEDAQRDVVADGRDHTPIRDGLGGGALAPATPSNSTGSSGGVSDGTVPGTGGVEVAPIGDNGGGTTNPGGGNNGGGTTNPGYDMARFKIPTDGLAKNDITAFTIKDFIVEMNTIRVENGLKPISPERVMVGLHDFSNLSQRHAEAGGSIPAHEGAVNKWNEVAMNNGRDIAHYYDYKTGTTSARGWWNSSAHRDIVYQPTKQQWYGTDDESFCFVYNEVWTTNSSENGWGGNHDARGTWISCELLQDGIVDPGSYNFEAIKSTDVDLSLRDYKLPEIPSGAKYNPNKEYDTSFATDAKKYRDSKAGKEYTPEYPENPVTTESGNHAASEVTESAADEDAPETEQVESEATAPETDTVSEEVAAGTDTVSEEATPETEQAAGETEPAVEEAAVEPEAEMNVETLADNAIDTSTVDTEAPAADGDIAPAAVDETNV